MRTILIRNISVNLIVIAILFLDSSIGLAYEDEVDWWQEARNASCTELTDAYISTTEAEDEVVAAIQASNASTAATNVVGVASVAFLGFGFFTWDDNATAEENLAYLREDLNIITTVAAEKNCTLPAR